MSVELSNLKFINATNTITLISLSWAPAPAPRNFALLNVSTNATVHMNLQETVANAFANVTFSRSSIFGGAIIDCSDQDRAPAVFLSAFDTTFGSESASVALNSSNIALSLNLDSCAVIGSVQVSVPEGAFRESFPPHILRNSSFSSTSSLTFGSIDSQQRSLSATLRGNRWDRPSDPRSGNAINVFGTHPATIDARGNYWGDPTGPYSCCNPTAVGVRVVAVDASSWCLDPDCLSYAAPLEDTWNNPSPRSCQLDILCTPTSASLQKTAIGTLVSLTVIAGALSLFFYRRISANRAESTAMLQAESRSPFAPVSLILTVANAIGATICLALMSVTYHSNPDFRTWLLPALVFISLVCGTRVFCSVWGISLLFLAPQRTGLFSNVIVSSVVVFFASTWHFSAWGSFFAAFTYSALLWTFYGTYVALELTVGVGSIFINSAIMLQREYKERTSNAPARWERFFLSFCSLLQRSKSNSKIPRGYVSWRRL